MDFIYAFILGVIEGLSEFLPISSTGHMILGMRILDIKMSEFWQSFLIIIQLGSILAVIFVFYERLIRDFKLWLKLCAAFFPTGLIGLFIAKYLDQLFNGYVVVFMLIFGGIFLIIIEKNPRKNEISSLDKISFKQAFLIGLIQALAMIPGTSRSAATIIGGLILGLNRKCAAEFSFLLAIPTMIIASVYSIYKNPQIISQANSLELLILGFFTAFFVAIFVIKFFLKFIEKFNFIPFGIYRIFLGILFLFLFLSGILDAGADFKL